MFTCPIQWNESQPESAEAALPAPRPPALPHRPCSLGRPSISARAHLQASRLHYLYVQGRCLGRKPSREPHAPRSLPRWRPSPRGCPRARALWCVCDSSSAGSAAAPPCSQPPRALPRPRPVLTAPAGLREHGAVGCCNLHHCILRRGGHLLQARGGEQAVAQPHTNAGRFTAAAARPPVLPLQRRQPAVALDHGAGGGARHAGPCRSGSNPPGDAGREARRLPVGRPFFGR